jgi:hypothetical protein
MNFFIKVQNYFIIFFFQKATTQDPGGIQSQGPPDHSTKAKITQIIYIHTYALCERV